MSNDLELHIGTTADSSGLRDAADELERSKRASDEAKESFKETSEELDKTRRSSDGAGDSFKRTAKDTRTLDQEIKDLRAHIVELGKAYDETGDKSFLKQIQADRSQIAQIERIKKDLVGVEGASNSVGKSFHETARQSHSLDDELKKLRRHLAEVEALYAATGDRSLFKSIRSDRSAIGQIEKIKNDLEDIAVDGEKATGVLAGMASSATKFFGSLGDVVGPLKYGLIAGVVAAAAEAGPLIVGGLGGAISTAVGAGGIAVGLVSAAKDPAVKSAMSMFGAELSDEFTAVGKPFVRPFQDALAILSADVKSLRLSDVFADAAPAATGLAHTLGDFAKNIMPGFDKALQRSGPYMDQLDAGLSTIGAGISSFLDDVSASPGDLQAFRQALDLAGTGLAMAGKLVANAGEAWHLLNHEWANFYHLAGKVAPGNLGDQFESLADRLDQYDQIGSHAIATTDLFGATVGATSAPIQTLGTNLDLATAATGALGHALSDTQQAFLGFMSADISAEQALDDFAKAVHEHGRSLDVHSQSGRDNLRILDELARAAEAAAEATFKQTGSVQKAQQTYEGFRKELYALLIQMHYTKEEAQRLVDQWLGMDGLTATLTVKVKIKKEGEAPFADLPKVSFGTSKPTQHRAGGGGVMPGVPYDINERAGTEVYFPERGRVANLSPWGGGGAPQQSRPVVLHGGGLGQLVFTWLREEIASRGGELAVLGLKA